jgi:hypothetical protein
MSKFNFDFLKDKITTLKIIKDELNFAFAKNAPKVILMPEGKIGLLRRTFRKSQFKYEQ